MKSSLAEALVGRLETVRDVHESLVDAAVADFEGDGSLAQHWEAHAIAINNLMNVAEAVEEWKLPRRSLADEGAECVAELARSIVAARAVKASKPVWTFVLANCDGTFALGNGVWATPFDAADRLAVEVLDVVLVNVDFNNSIALDQWDRGGRDRFPTLNKDLLRDSWPKACMALFEKFAGMTRILRDFELRLQQIACRMADQNTQHSAAVEVIANRSLACLSATHSLIEFAEVCRPTFAPSVNPTPELDCGKTNSKKALAIKTKRKRVNERMLVKLQSEPQCVAWSVKQWAQFLNCSKSAVAETKAWANVNITRKLLQADRIS